MVTDFATLTYKQLSVTPAVEYSGVYHQRNGFTHLRGLKAEGY